MSWEGKLHHQPVIPTRRFGNVDGDPALPLYDSLVRVDIEVFGPKIPRDWARFPLNFGQNALCMFNTAVLLAKSSEYRPPTWGNLASKASIPTRPMYPENLGRIIQKT
jgi:hypothetical protein